MLYISAVLYEIVMKSLKKYFKDKYKYKYSPVKVFKIQIENTVGQKYLKN